MTWLGAFSFSALAVCTGLFGDLDVVQHLVKLFELIEFVLHFLQLLSHFLHLICSFAVGLFAHAFFALAHLLCHLFHLLHLLVHHLHLVEFLLEFFGTFLIAIGHLLLDLLLKILLGLFVIVDHLLHVFLQLVELFFELLLFVLVETFVSHFLFQLLDFIDGLLQIAVFDSLGDFFSRTLVDILHVLHLLFHLVGTTKLLATLLEFFGEIAEFDESFLRVKLFLLGDVAENLLGLGFQFEVSFIEFFLVGIFCFLLFHFGNNAFANLFHIFLLLGTQLV